MPRTQSSRTYDAPKERLWQAFADIENVDQIAPHIRACERTNEVEGVGAARISDVGGGRKLQETVVEWDEGSLIVFEVQPPPGTPMKYARTSFAFETRGRGCAIRATMDFDLKGGPLLALIIRPKMKKALTGILRGAGRKASDG